MRIAPTAFLATLAALTPTSVAHAGCVRTDHTPAHDRVRQALCVNATETTATYHVAARLRGGSHGQTVVLRLQHREGGRWVTDQSAGLGYATPISYEDGRLRQRRERVSASRISLELDRDKIGELAAAGAPVRLRATSATSGQDHSLRAVIARRLRP